MTTLETEAKPNVLTVTQLNQLARHALENRFDNVWVEGEISNFKLAPSGHRYFTLKDSTAQVSAALFKTPGSRLKFKLENGLEVLVRGRATIYPAQGKYQIIVDYMEPREKGALQLAFEQLKKKLKAEGFFDESRKKLLPPYPEIIGIITSEQGAAVRDILSVLRRRWEGLHIRLMPVPVQGEGSAAKIAQAIRDFNKDFPDTEVLLVGRGGGSIEDLWAFNEEIVARAIHASEIPIVSCVGHETDFTIADFVADKRAATPSAAAELAVQERLVVLEHVRSQTVRLSRGLRSLVLSAEERLKALLRSPYFQRPERIFEQKAQRIDDLSGRLAPALRRLVHSAEDRLAAARRLPAAAANRVRLAEKDLRRFMEKLDALSPLKVLGRGYAIVFTEPGKKTLRKASEVRTGDSVRVRLGEGEFKAEVTGEI